MHDTILILRLTSEADLKTKEKIISQIWGDS